MIDTAETPAVPFPWDVPADEPPTLYLATSFSVGPQSEISLWEHAAADGSWGANLNIDGAGYTHVAIGIGVGYPGDAEIIEVAGRLINVLEQARENARNRIAARSAVSA